VVFHHDPTLIGLNCLNEQGERRFPDEVVFQVGPKIPVDRNSLAEVAYPVVRRVRPFLAAFPDPIDLD